MPRGKAESGTAKQRNKRWVLDLIRTNSPIARTQLADITGLNKATISLIVNELMQQGIVAEVGIGMSASGRKPMLLSFVADCAYVVGVMVQADLLHIAVTDLEAHVVYREVCPVSAQGVDAVLRCLGDALEGIATRAGIGTAAKIAGIGVGIPGQVDFTTGIVMHAPNMNLQGVHLRQYLQMRCGVPVWVDNIANVMAFGERLHGVGRRYDDFVYLSVATGIGGGIVTSGVLQRGAGGFAGEFGHMIVEPHGLACACGGSGCLEMYASLRALHRLVSRGWGDERPYHPSIVRDVVTAAEQGDAAAIEALHTVGLYLGIGIVNIVCAYNPQAILVGNEITMAERWIRPVVDTVVKTRCPAALRQDVHILMQPYSPDAAVAGAASLGIYELLARWSLPSSSQHTTNGADTRHGA